MSYNNHKIHIATLNCRGLKKIGKPQKRQHFIRYLRSAGYDILVLQETHATDSFTIEQFNLQFQTKSSIWNSRTGIVSLNPRYSVKHIDSGMDGGRYILADIQLNNHNTEQSIATILNIYGPVGADPIKSRFYKDLTTIDTVSQALLQPHNNIFIMGDFNYKSEQRREDGTFLGTSPEWISLLDDRFLDCFLDQKQITWKSGNSSSIIDYVYCSAGARPFVQNTSQQFINNNWTDHAMLGFSFSFQSDCLKGPGSWKCNPFLAKKKHFRSALASHLTQLTDDFELIKSFSTSQQLWDWIKEEVKRFVKSFQIEDLNWRKKQLLQLQKKRNRFLRQNKHRGLLYTILPRTEQQISALQESIAEIEVLKAGKFWRENGERSAGLLKRLTISREHRRQIRELIDPVDDVPTTEQSHIETIVQSFYSNLYSPDSVDDEALNQLLEQIPSDVQLDSDQQELLLDPIQFEEIILESKRSPRQSSPGSDSLPYEILHLVMRFEPYHDLICAIYNDALKEGIFPASWNTSIMTLLPKKGNLSDIRNHRPISLANTDYKIFTRILNQRLMSVSTNLINNNQLGFIPGRYIAENGLTCQIIMEDADRKKDIAHKYGVQHVGGKGIGLLLDQEKAYDRVNLDYLKAVLLRFGFPLSTVECIYNLMAKNTIRININGFFTEDVHKLRGLKQGDPISPILYNLAFEPFLRSILNDEHFHGYNMLPDLVADSSTEDTINTKILCYADDALVLVHDIEDLSRLNHHMDVFCNASNAKFNFNKVEAFSLSGQNTWDYWSGPLMEMNITKLVTEDDPNPVIYLGFPMIQSTQQRNNFVGSFIAKLRAAVQPHLSRSLSVVGKATVVNSLILSKCWYLFRVTPLTQQALQQITSVAIQFCRKNIFPVIPWYVWTAPRSSGGLGILDPKVQYLALFFRWIQPLLLNSLHNHQLTKMLALHINNRNSSRYHHIPILFPSTRSTGLPKKRIATIDILYSALDCIPRNFESTTVTPATALILPLTVIFLPSTNHQKIPKKAQGLTGGDLFVYNSTIRCLHWKNPTEFDPAWGMSPKLLQDRLASGQLQLAPFFETLCRPTLTEFDEATTVDCRPLSQALDFAGKSIDEVPKISTKLFRQACINNLSSLLPDRMQQIQTQNWLCFWSLALVAVQRNAVYRLLSGAIPHRSLLHRFFPDKFPSPVCKVCSNSTPESTEHLLFYCHPKSIVWKEIIFEFLWPTVDIHDIKLALYSLDFYNVRYCQISGISAPLIIVITLANVWKAHFRSVIDDTPFLWPSVMNLIRTDIKKHVQESQLHSLL